MERNEMKRYEIHDELTGRIFGIYRGRDEMEAIKALLEDAEAHGFADEVPDVLDPDCTLVAIELEG